MTTVVVTLESAECCKCHGTFGMTATAVRDYRRNHETFYCPYCRNPLHYPGESDIQRAERLKREAEERLTRERAKHDQTKAELRETERRRRAEKGAKTRIKNRVANGVCPCCNRYFANLHRHMSNQHPEFSAAEVD